MWRILFVALIFALAGAAQDRRIQPIVPHKQVALVIGNAAYRDRPLSNSVHDAQAVAGKLRGFGFEVDLATDADRKAMGQAIDRFVDRLGTGDVALFYYSGHGVQVDGENYLIPVDFQGKDETDVRYDAHPVGRIQERMERSGAQLNILVLDACRDNPFRSGSRSALSGLAAMTGGRGTFIAFATSPGKTASDNPNQQNGLFTQYLLDAMSTPGLGLGDVFDVVREKVDAASGGKQLPWSLSSVVGRYSFVAGSAAPLEVAKSAPPPRVPAPEPVASRPASTAPNGIGDLDISTFAGLSARDTKATAIAALGKPTQSDDHMLTYGGTPHVIRRGGFGRRELVVAAPDIQVELDDQSPRIAAVQVFDSKRARQKSRQERRVRGAAEATRQSGIQRRLAVGSADHPRAHGRRSDRIRDESGEREIGGVALECFELYELPGTAFRTRRKIHVGQSSLVAAPFQEILDLASNSVGLHDPAASDVPRAECL